MSNSGSESEFSDEEQGAQTFSIQPYQFEPRVNTDERDINAESLSGDESMEGSEELNPRLENSDWYVLCCLLHCNSFTDVRNKLLFGPDVVFVIVSFLFFFRFESLEYVNISLERLRFTFTPNGRREFVPRDQVFPLFFAYSSLLLRKNK